MSRNFLIIIFFTGIPITLSAYLAELSVRDNAREAIAAYQASSLKLAEIEAYISSISEDMSGYEKHDHLVYLAQQKIAVKHKEKQMMEHRESYERIQYFKYIGLLISFWGLTGIVLKRLIR